MKYVHFVKFAQAVTMHNAEVLAQYSPEVSQLEVSETVSVIDDMCAAIMTASMYAHDDKRIEELACDCGLYDYIEAYANSDAFNELQDLVLLYSK